MSNSATLGIWLEAPDKIKCCECETRRDLSYIVLLFPMEGEKAEIPPEILHVCTLCWPRARAKLQELHGLPSDPMPISSELH